MQAGSHAFRAFFPGVGLSSFSFFQLGRPAASCRRLLQLPWKCISSYRTSYASCSIRGGCHQKWGPVSIVCRAKLRTERCAIHGASWWMNSKTLDLPSGESPACYSSSSKLHGNRSLLQLADRKADSVPNGSTMSNPPVVVLTLSPHWLALPY